MLGVVADDDEVKDRETGGFIRERANLVGLGTELAEEALQQVRGADQRMEALVKRIKVQAGVKVQAQTPYHLRFARAPDGLERAPAGVRLGAGGGFKDRMGLNRHQLPPYPTGFFRRERLRAIRQAALQFVVDEGPFEPPYLVHHTTLLLRMRKAADNCGGQTSPPVTDHELDLGRIKATLDQRGKQLLPGGGILRRGGLIVQDLAAAIGPEPHDREHDSFGPPDLLALVPALIRPRLARGHVGCAASKRRAT